ncbi:MAG: helix-turn-helix domain-containing protein [Acidimicrobiales bacterium]
MLIVGTDEAAVEQDLLSGRLACPACGGPLKGWGHSCSRPLHLRGGEVVRFTPRRSICRAHPKAKTHVLVPDSSLLRRRDHVEVIGSAVAQHAEGAGQRPIAAALGVSREKVRGWLRGFATSAEAIRAHFTRWAHALDPELGAIAPGRKAVADALSAIGVAVRAYVLRFGPTPAWQVVARLSGGVLLCNTRFPFPAVP